MYSRNRNQVTFHIRLALVFPPSCCKNITFFKDCVILMDILTRANWPVHSPASSFCQSFLPIFGWSLAIHIIGILWIGTQKEVCVKDYFLMSPTPISSASTSKALSKFHWPPINTFLFSPLVANLNKNTLSLILSIFTYITVLHACCIADFKPSLLTPLVSMTFPTKQFAVISPPPSCRFLHSSH